MEFKKIFAQFIADIIGYSSVAITATQHISFFNELRDGNITTQDMYMVVGLIWLTIKVVNDGRKLFEKKIK